MITQKEFTKKLKETVNTLIGKSYRVEVRLMEKINIGTVHTLVILDGDSNVSPSFYIEQLYSSYQQGEATVEEMAQIVVNAYYNASPSMRNEIATYLNDSEWIKERLFLQLINRSKNKKLLKDSIHIDFQELSLVVYIKISEDIKGVCKSRLTKTLCRHFEWNEKEILDYALENTSYLFPYRISPLSKLLQEITGNIDISIPDLSIEVPEMIILTNDIGINGATAVFYPNVLKELAKKCGTSLFLLPSSIHEFLVLEDNGIYRPEELKEMVQEVNISAVSPEEVLSDNIYYYGRNSGILSVFNNGKLEEVAMP